MYLGLLCYGFALNYYFVIWTYQGHVRYLSESNRCLFYIMQQQKVKFTSVQINIEHVLYMNRYAIWT